MPREFLDRAVVPIRNAAGAELILAGDRVAHFTSEAGLGFDAAHRPGSLKEMLRQMASGSPEETYMPEPLRPEFKERTARITTMDRQGVERCVLFPSGMALSAEHYVSDTEALFANLFSFNRWFDETWGFNFQDRIHASAMLSLRDLEKSVALADQVIERGARVVLVPTGPAYGRSPGDPYFDPVWARFEEAQVTVAFHIMPFWYFDASPTWGHDPDPPSWHMSAWQWNNLYGDRPIQDTLSALIFDNLFGRFPGLRCLVAEHGAEWVPHFLRRMDKSRGMGRNGPWIGGALSERPSAVFQRHVRVVPYPEDDVKDIVERLGGVDAIVMGSDFPHAEGLAEPADFAELVSFLGEDDRRSFMSNNAAQLFEARRRP